jgi:hypothetical protein
MHVPTTPDLALAGHWDVTERALAALRSDHTLDDHERRRRITRVIESANARTVELLRRRQQSTPAAVDRQTEPDLSADWRSSAAR